jgi:hypothetical protein
VVTQSGCTWSASGGAPWATLTTASGSGQGDAVYMVQANTATSTRSTSITINGQSHSVTQDAAAPTCTYTLQPTSQNFSPAGGTGQFSITTQPTCAWSATGGAPWTTIGTSSGTGSGSVSYTVQANSGAARQTTISVNGQSHSVTQDAAPPPPPPPPPCTYSIDPASRDFTLAGGEGTARVITGSTCTWTASSSVPWVTMGTASGTGPGEVRYTVAPLASGTRETTLSIASQPHTVRQQ